MNTYLFYKLCSHIYNKVGFVFQYCEQQGRRDISTRQHRYGGDSRERTNWILCVTNYSENNFLQGLGMCCFGPLGFGDGARKRPNRSLPAGFDQEARL